MQPPPIPNANPYAAPQAPVSDVWAQQGPYVVEHAGFWLRFVAYIIDWFITTVAGGIIGGVLGAVLGLSMARSGVSEDVLIVGNLLGAGVGLIISWLYYALAESSNRQATLGKKALGLRVTDLNGAPIGFGRASGRYWGKLLSSLFLCIGYIMVGVTERKQGLHDMMAGTLVVRG